MRRLILALLLSVNGLPATAAALPMKGRSLGGVVRAAPDMASQRLGSLRENEPITILKKTDASMNGYAWFQIVYRGRTAYQWGGIMCSDEQLEGIYQACQ